MQFAKDFFDRFPSFLLREHDRVTIDGWVTRYVGTHGGFLEFMDADNPHLTEVFEVQRFNRLNAAGKIIHEPDYFLHKMVKAASPAMTCDDSIAELTPAHRARVEAKYAMVRAYQDRRNAGLLKVNSEAIEACMDDLCRAAEEYMTYELPDPERADARRRWKEEGGRKPRSAGAVIRPDACSARTLREWASNYHRSGKSGLKDKVENRGNWQRQFSIEEQALLSKTVRDHYFTLRRPPQTKTVEAVELAFLDENKVREAEQRPLLRTPKRDAVRREIGTYGKFEKLVLRFGAEEAMRKMRAVKAGLKHARPLERVEMDEWKVDLHTIMSSCGLFELFDSNELESLGLLDPTRRWWVVVAIDSRTRVILGMVLTSNPKSSAAVRCLDMIVSDKGMIATAAGAESPWNMLGLPEILATDNGSAFKSGVFTNACSDLGIHALQTIAGSPGMRGKIERLFRTASLSALSDLSGKTFSNAYEKGEYGSEKMACLSVEDLSRILVRWIVDIYHNTPHEGLNGLTPLEQWQVDMSSGNYPLHAAPSYRQKRLAFGIHATRKVQKTGIQVLNVQYHSGALHEWFMKHGNQSVQIRWCGRNIGQIEAKLDDGWLEIPAVEERFDGVTAQEWTATMRALTAKYAKSREISDAIVFRALAEIRALNSQRMMSMGILDEGMDTKNLDLLEKQAKGSFAIVSAQPGLAKSPDGLGHSIMPVEPTAPSPHMSKQIEREMPQPKNSWLEGKK
ncbi:transposase [Loktanella sp. SALINAS62]|nr:transposase [Loktanella sp. SALINAS62]